MDPQPYDNLSNQDLCALCVWREARGEGSIGKRGVAHVILNRMNHGGYGGSDVHGVVLKPYQFSSFLESDPNSELWPLDEDALWIDSQQAAQAVLLGFDTDITAGALFYFSRPLTEPPSAWGPVGVTLVVGHLTFCKPVL